MEGDHVSTGGGSFAEGFSSCGVEALSSRACMALGKLCSVSQKGRDQVGLGWVGDAEKYGPDPFPAVVLNIPSSKKGAPHPTPWCHGRARAVQNVGSQGFQ